jgi:hypothetical protein
MSDGAHGLRRRREEKSVLCGSGLAHRHKTVYDFPLRYEYTSAGEYIPQCIYLHL